MISKSINKNCRIKRTQKSEKHGQKMLSKSISKNQNTYYQKSQGKTINKKHNKKNKKQKALYRASGKSHQNNISVTEGT